MPWIKHMPAPCTHPDLLIPDHAFNMGYGYGSLYECDDCGAVFELCSGIPTGITADYNQSRWKLSKKVKCDHVTITDNLLKKTYSHCPNCGEKL